MNIWAAVAFGVAALIFAAWLLRYEKWETSQGAYLIDRWRGTIQECVSEEGCTPAF